MDHLVYGKYKRKLVWQILLEQVPFALRNFIPMNLSLPQELCMKDFLNYVQFLN